MQAHLAQLIDQPSLTALTPPPEHPQCLISHLQLPQAPVPPPFQPLAIPAQAAINRNLLKALNAPSKQTPQMNRHQVQVKSKKCRIRLRPHKKNSFQTYKQRDLSLHNDFKDSAFLTSFNYRPDPQTQKQDVKTTLQEDRKNKNKKQIKKQSKKIALERTNPDDNQLSSEQEYDEEAVPGPGHYSLPQFGKKSFRSKRKDIQHIFYNKLDRFTSPTLQFQLSPNQETKNVSAASQKGFFLSRLPKFQIPRLENSPPPGYYNTRQTLQHDLVRNILKSANSTNFISSLPRTPFQKLPNQLPGPGSYNLDLNSESIDQDCSYFFKSSIPRQLSYLQPHSKVISETKLTSQLNTSSQGGQIHVQPDSILQKQYSFESPPFLSGSERFPSVSKSSELSQLPSPRKQFPPKVNRVPFNSSVDRLLQVKGGEGVGVGLYGALRLNWQKRSHNLYMN